MKVKKYLNEEKEAERSGSHKSLWTSRKGVEEFQEAQLPKLPLWCFLKNTFGTNTISIKNERKTSHHIMIIYLL